MSPVLSESPEKVYWLIFTFDEILFQVKILFDASKVQFTRDYTE